MTAITVVSTFTTISPKGKVNLADCSVQRRTVGEIKEEIAQTTQIDRERQSLWWHGYRLDNDEQTVLDACVDLSTGEKIDPNAKELVLFLTVPIEKRLTGPVVESRARSGSFEHWKEIARRRNSNGDSCVVT